MEKKRLITAFAIGSISDSTDSFVLRKNNCAEKRAHRKSAKRKRQ